jgi:hypothetical protein
VLVAAAHRSELMTKVFYQAVQGIWSPRDQAYSYVVCEEFDTYKEAKQWAVREGKTGDPTLAILEVRSKVLWRSRPVSEAA